MRHGLNGVETDGTGGTAAPFQRPPRSPSTSGSIPGAGIPGWSSSRYFTARITVTSRVPLSCGSTTGRRQRRARRRLRSGDRRARPGRTVEAKTFRGQTRRKFLLEDPQSRIRDSSRSKGKSGVSSRRQARARKTARVAKERRRNPDRGRNRREAAREVRIEARNEVRNAIASAGPPGHFALKARAHPRLRAIRPEPIPRTRAYFGFEPGEFSFRPRVPCGHRPAE